MAYAYFGQHMPGILVHPGASWPNIVNHLYLTSQGIYGTALGVIATYVFHFVLFGVMATWIGLGQLFIDVASAFAGRYAGGPAKVSVLSSAMLGTISGSSIANTVTTGALTILDVRVGGVPATPCDRAALDRFSSGWVSSPTGTTVKHWMDDPDPTIFYVYPAQSASPASAVVTHTYVPDALTAQLPAQTGAASGAAP